MDEEVRREQIRKDLRSLFEQTLEEQVDRVMTSRVHPIIPAHYFASVSSECAEVYREGRFFSAISLAQSLVDGISKFILKRNNLGSENDFDDRLKKLTRGLISQESADAMRRIWVHRHEFHHLNPSVPTDLETLRQIASANRDDLSIIEGEIFGFTHVNQAIVPHKPKYWEYDSNGLLKVNLRLHLE